MQFQIYYTIRKWTFSKVKEEGKEDIKKLSANPYLANLEDFLGTTDTMKRLFSALIEIERTLIRYMMMQ